VNRPAWIAAMLLALVAAAANAGEPAQSLRIVVTKSTRTMQVYEGANLVKTWRVGLGLNPAPPKRRAGDRATPEGEYRVCGKKPHAAYYIALVLSYPNLADAELALKERRISRRQYERIRAAGGGDCPPFDTPLGGLVEIHGEGSGADWTWGCIALDNPEMRALYDMTPVGTPVLIRP
jgi:murein L,D-transpeptidase YafK